MLSFIIMCVHYTTVTYPSIPNYYVFRSLNFVFFSVLSCMVFIHVKVLFLFCSSSKFVILDETTQVNETIIVISLLLFINANYWSSLIYILFVGPHLSFFTVFIYLIFVIFVCNCLSFLFVSWLNFCFCFCFVMTWWFCHVCVCVCVCVYFI